MLRKRLLVTTILLAISLGLLYPETILAIDDCSSKGIQISFTPYVEGVNGQPAKDASGNPLLDTGKEITGQLAIGVERPFRININIPESQVHQNWNYFPTVRIEPNSESNRAIVTGGQSSASDTSGNVVVRESGYYKFHW